VGVVAAVLTFRGTQSNINYQEREAWRTRQIEAAQGFVFRYTDALSAMGEEASASVVASPRS
jgi:hypothetical protein